MKRFRIGMSSLVLLCAIGTSFAFRTAEAKNRAAFTCTWYDYNGAPGEEFDPAKYTLSAGTPSWPGQGGDLGAICVDPSDVYASGTYAGKPMVDDMSTPIANVVNWALVSLEDNPQEDFNEIADLKAAQ